MGEGWGMGVQTARNICNHARVDEWEVQGCYHSCFLLIALPLPLTLCHCCTYTHRNGYCAIIPKSRATTRASVSAVWCITQNRRNGRAGGACFFAGFFFVSMLACGVEKSFCQASRAGRLLLAAVGSLGW